MRKLFFIGLFLLSIVLLTGCGENEATVGVGLALIDGEIVTILDVSSAENDSESVDIALAYFNIPTTTSEALDLVDYLGEGFEISWASSNVNIVTNDGNIYQYPEISQATLTVTVKLNDVTSTKDFVVSVSALENLSTKADVDASEVDSTHHIFGEVIGIEDTGYYVYADETIIFVEGSRALHSIVYVTGTKVDANISTLIETSVDTYPETSNTVLELQKRVIGYYAEQDPDNPNVYGSWVSTNGLLTLIDDVPYITSGDIKIKVSSETSDAIYDALIESAGEKIDFVGILRSHDGSDWEVTIINPDFVTYTELNDTERNAEIVKWIYQLIPQEITDETMLNLPSTHPVFGGTITWGLSGTDGIIATDGTINRPIQNTSFEITFTVQTNNLTVKPDAISLTIGGLLVDLSQVITEANYNEAKANWNSIGNYTFPGTYNITGQVYYKSTTNYVILKDLNTENFVFFYDLLPTAGVNLTELGDIIRLEATTLKTSGKRLILSGGSIVDIENVSGFDRYETRPFELTNISFEDYKALDFESFDTYNHFYNIEKVYIAQDADYYSGAVGFNQVNAASDMTLDQIKIMNFNDKNYPYDKDLGNYYASQVYRMYVNVAGVAGSFESSDLNTPVFINTEYLTNSSLTNEEKMEVMTDYFTYKTYRLSKDGSYYDYYIFHEYGLDPENESSSGLYTSLGEIYMTVSEVTVTITTGSADYYEINATSSLDYYSQKNQLVPVIKNEDGDDITPGYVLLVNMIDSYYRIDVEQHPEGFEYQPYTIHVKVVYDLLDSNLDSTGDTLTFEFDREVEVGKPDAGITTGSIDLYTVDNKRKETYENNN